MKFHLICQEESANVKKLLGNKKKSWEMWRKALSNYSVYLGSSWWNIYITVMEVLRVIKLVRWVSSLFPHFSNLFLEEKTNMWTKPLFLMMELLCSRAAASRLSEWLLFYSILSVCHLYPFELERMQYSEPLTVQNRLQRTYRGFPEGITKVGYCCVQHFDLWYFGFVRECQIST